MRPAQSAVVADPADGRRAGQDRLAGGRALFAVPGWRLDLALVLLVSLAALGLRWPGYQTIPGFSDEVKDIYRGLLAARGELLPLTDTQTYIGSLWDWLMAGAFLASGFNLAAPRTLVMSFGVLTVAASYPLGKAWSGDSRLAGALTAALLATSAVHIAINSHVAWSNCITPLFTTLGAWALWLAVERARAPEHGIALTPTLSRARERGLICARTSALPLAAAGLFWGLALQTHPSVLGLLPGAAVFLLWKAPALLRTRWLWLAVSLAILVNANLIAYNAQTGFGSVAGSLYKSASYTANEALTLGLYLERLRLLALGLLQGLAGALDLRDDGSDYLLDPAVWPIALVALAGLVGQWRRGNPLPLLLVVSTALILPIFNDKYRPILNGRYLAPLLPVLYGCVAAWLVAGLGGRRQSFDRLRMSGAGGGSDKTPASSTPTLNRLATPSSAACRLPPAAYVVPLVAFLLFHPLLYLQAYYDQAIRAGRTNDGLFQLRRQIQTAWPGNGPVLVDQALELRRIGWGSGWVGGALSLTLAVDRIPAQVVDPHADDLLDPAKRCRDRLLVLDGRAPDFGPELLTRLDARDLDRRPARPAGPPYRLLWLPRLASSC